VYHRRKKAYRDRINLRIRKTQLKKKKEEEEEERNLFVVLNIK